MSDPGYIVGRGTGATLICGRGAGRAGPIARRAVLGGALAGLLALAGCGFRLEGHTPLPAKFKLTQVEARDRQSDFVQGLRNALLANGAQLSENGDKATAVVHVAQDQVTQRVLSVTPDNLPREYELTYTVRFSVSAGGGDLLPEQEVTSTREYSFNVNELLAKGNEEDVLRQALARDLVDQVMRRLSSL